MIIKHNYVIEKDNEVMMISLEAHYDQSELNYAQFKVIKDAVTPENMLVSVGWAPLFDIFQKADAFANFFLLST